MGKLQEVLLRVLETLKKSYKRFPETISISVIFVIVAIVNNRIDSDPNDVLRNLMLVLGIGIPISACIVQVLERFDSRIMWRIEAGVILVAIGCLFYILIPDTIGDKFMTRYGFASAFAYLMFATIPYMMKRRQYGLYLIKLITSFFITYLYTIVLYLGVVAIIFTIDVLFNLNIDEAIYFDIFMISVGVFGLTYYLGRVPELHDNITDYKYPVVFRVLFSAIVMPLITVYTLVLYAYLIRILVQVGWRDTMISQLVLWYGFVSIVLLILIKPLIASSKWVKQFSRFYPFAMLVPLIMLIVNICLRMSDYGITVPRALVAISGLWFMVAILYEVISSKKVHQLITLSFIVIYGLSVFMPVNVFSSTINSQLSRLNEVLIEQGILVDGQIVSKENVDKGIVRTVSSQLEVLSELNALDRVEALSNDFELRDMDEVFGFSYASPYYMDGFGTRYINFYHWRDTVFDISDYQYHRRIRTGRNDSDMVTLEEGILKIDDPMGISITVDIGAYVDAHDVGEYHREEQETAPIIMTITGTDYSGELIIYELNGESRDDQIQIYNLEGDLYYSIESISD